MLANNLVLVPNAKLAQAIVVNHRSSTNTCSSTSS
jgi:hypothetical protein